MPSSFSQHLEKKLTQQRDAGLYRELKVVREGLMDFASNDYLGLARSKELFEQIRSNTIAFELNGSTGSRLLTGNSAQAESTENTLKTFFRSESALVFNSGYAANLAVLSSLPQRGDTILYDELCHASIKDGARLSLARRLNFRHNNTNDLEAKLKRCTGNKFIVVESIYSMDGDETPLSEIVQIAESYDAHIILDEAHSTGVVGNDGSGFAIQSGLERRVAVRIYTFGKGLGVHGACVVGSAALKDFLINFARPFIYTTAPDHHSLITIQSAVSFVTRLHTERGQLRENIINFLSGLPADTRRTSSESAIQTIIIPGNHEVRRIAMELQNEGFDVRPIMSPTVPKGEERLRICIHSFNTPEEIQKLDKALKISLWP